MLKQLITRNYDFVIKNTTQILYKVSTDYRKIAKNNHYCLRINKRGIRFSQRFDYQNKDCSEIVKVNKNNGSCKSMEQWNIVSYFLLVVGIMGYVLVNSKTSAEEKDNENITEGSDLQLPEKLGLSQKLMKGLPAPVENYVDLQGKRKLLDQTLKSQDIVVISGAGGMGKSTLAAQYGHECQQRDDMKVVWIKGTQIEEEFFRLAALLGIETNGLNNGLIRNLVYGNLQMLFDRKVLLFIFDNVETKEKIEKYLINLPNSAKVIITARNGDLLEGIKPFRVKGFKQEEATFYLKQSVKISEKEAKQIINVVGESPFRLSIITAYVKNYPSRNVNELTEKYLQIKRGQIENEAIYPEVEMLFRNLKKDSPKGWELLKYLTYLDAEGVSVQLIGIIMDQTVNELQEAINKLREMSLVKANERKVKVTHRIVQEETKKALNEENKSQSQKILEKLIQKVDREFPIVNENPENWGKVMEIISHAKMLIEETKEENQTAASRDNLLLKIGAYFYYINFNYREAINHWEELLKHQTSIHTESRPDVASLFNNIGWAHQNLGGTENMKKGLQYYEASLKMNQELYYSGNHPDVASSLSNVGMAYGNLGGTGNVKKGLQYQKASLKMRQALFPGDHPDVASSLNNVGLIYGDLGGAGNIKKGLHYHEASLKMRQELYSGNHADVARSLNNVGLAYQNLGGTENVQKGLQYQEASLKMRQALFPGNNPAVARSLNNVGRAYQDLGGTENIKKGLQYLEASLKMRQALFPGNQPDVASSLNNIGGAYRALGGTENMKRGLQYLEASLKMRQALFPGNQPDVAISLNNVQLTYQDLGDLNKALEYLKQAYGINSSMFDEDYAQTKAIKSAIESLQPDFFVNQGDAQIFQQQSCLGGNRIGSECRWMIATRQTMNDELITLKQGIQKSVLNEIVKAAENYGWTNISLLGSDYGVKGYIEKRHLEDKLKGLSNNSSSENIEFAQMLCFESMNLGLMKSKKKPYEVVEGFTRENPDLVKKIAEEHPEFFVDGSIVEACIKAMPNDKSFEEHLLKHVKYMGMELRQERIV